MSKLPYGPLICTLVQEVTIPVQARGVAAYLKVFRHMNQPNAERSRLGSAQETPSRW